VYSDNNFNAAGGKIVPAREWEEDVQTKKRGFIRKDLRAIPRAGKLTEKGRE